ncbi:MAG: copper amine oxidase N-terminal domain-containing protein [Epulopiscium sp.]|nr:copper amine oxidase N-terminal domain-containing protein [Candidatus Epulonipiscium sp.]
MKRKLTVILAISIFITSSFTLLATEPIASETAKASQKQIILQLDDTLAWVDGVEYTLIAKPRVIKDRTYLPLRFMGDMVLGAKVDWQSETKTVVISKDNKKTEITIGSNEAYINGDKFYMEETPIIVEDSAYLPVRATSDLFGIHTDYDEKTRRVILTNKKEEDNQVPSPPEVKAPVAQFSFDMDTYTEGQVVKAIDQSFHEEGKAITNKLWMVGFDESKANTNLENIFNKPKAGTYLVSLKVEAGKGNWSEWTSREVVVKPNQKPVITSLKPSKPIYAGGELMGFEYAYDNESWEDIKTARWTYRKEGEVISKSVIKKPQRIFQSGRYIVTLQLQDDFGNWSDIKETYVEISEKSLITELEYRFTEGKPGDIIDNFHHFNYRDYDKVEPDKVSSQPGTLFVSNSPENVRYNGILYRDTVSGVGRILLHHYNQFTEEENINDPKKLVLLAENNGDKPAIITISNRADRGPSSDVLFVGGQLLYDYLKGGPAKTYKLEPGEKILLYDSANTTWGNKQLLSSQMDFDIVGQVTLTSASMSKKSSIDDIKKLPKLERDAHQRGTFNALDFYYDVKADNKKPTYIELGAGVEEWVYGHDALTGKTVQNRGNYAMNYEIKITAEEDMGILINPRGGLFRGALKWDDGEAFLAPNNGYVMGESSKGILIGVVKAGETRTLTYSLPNGSSAPVLLVMMPKDEWKH